MSSITWSVDPTVHVDRVHVIESLPANEQSWFYRTGARLFDELRDTCASMSVVPSLHVIGTRDELFDLLRQVVIEAESGHFPLLHFEGFRGCAAVGGSGAFPDRDQ